MNCRIRDEKSWSDKKRPDPDQQHWTKGANPERIQNRINDKTAYFLPVFPDTGSKIFFVEPDLYPNYYYHEKFIFI